MRTLLEATADDRDRSMGPDFLKLYQEDMLAEIAPTAVGRKVLDTFTGMVKDTPVKIYAIAGTVADELAAAGLGLADGSLEHASIRVERVASENGVATYVAFKCRTEDAPSKPAAEPRWIGWTDKDRKKDAPQIRYAA